MGDVAAPAVASTSGKGYRAYVLGALVLVYTFNFIDRTLVGILQEPIRNEFHLLGWQLGLLGGVAFALLYAVLGVPIAYWAERGNRITIITLGFALWSAATAFCGVAASYLLLFLGRVGVGIGEAACTPPSASVISDYFPAEKRATALGIYSLGVPLGAMIAALGGGWLAEHAHDLFAALGVSGLAQLPNWRAAFLLLGAPGVALALVFRLTVREPARKEAKAAPTFIAALKALSGKRSFWHTAFAGALVAFVGYGTTQFLVSHFVLSYGLTVAQGAYAFALVAAVATASGTFLGGFLGDRWSASHPRSLSWLSALGLVLAAPFYLISLTQHDFLIGFSIFFFGPVFHYLYLGPMFAVSQSVAEPRMRATTAAILIFIVTLIGYGLGPLFVGVLWDVFAARELGHYGLSRLSCAEFQAFAAVHPEAHEPAIAQCTAGLAAGLRMSLAITVCVLFWAALHFLLAMRTYLKDRVG